MMKHRILLGSVLKPTNDSRMYEKIGESLSVLPNSEIHVAGYKSEQNDLKNIRFYPIFSSARLSVLRFIAPWKFLFLAVKVKPHTIICSTHELLLVTCLYKILFGCKFIYDVQENYFYNILYTDTFPSFLKPVLAHWVKLKETVCKKQLDGYLLAEKTYQQELNGRIHEPALVLENKYQGACPNKLEIVKITEGNKIRLLYSGTIDTSYGVFEAIDLIIRLYLLDFRFELTIIGFAPNNRELTKVKNRIAPYPFIKLIGGDKPVPHPDILSAIKTHDFGLLPYRFNESTTLRVPTKLFEYLLNHLPVISSHNKTWEEYIKKFNAGIIIPFSDLPKATIIKEQILNTEFYTQGNPAELIWEESKLLNWYSEHFLN
ncbi:glycosyltransferase [Cytophaga hutchinsonii]|nr:glycosyltransferase [Cytophaga hutchinsonii]